MSMDKDKDKDKQGAAAARSGRAVEDIIATILDGRCVPYDRQRVICLGIYDTPIAADFYLPQVRSFRDGVVIESKWQDVSGSADEKLPYLLLNIQQRYPCPAIIIADGGGARPGAVAWLRDQIDGQHLIGVFTLAKFVTWARRNLL